MNFLIIIRDEPSGSFIFMIAVNTMIRVATRRFLSIIFGGASTATSIFFETSTFSGLESVGAAFVIELLLFKSRRIMAIFSFTAGIPG